MQHLQVNTSLLAMLRFSHMLCSLLSSTFPSQLGLSDFSIIPMTGELVLVSRLPL